MNIESIIDFYKNSTTDVLAREANNICEQNYGNNIYLRGLIEFSNYCSRDCLYCGIRKSNHNVTRYRLTHKQIINAVKKGYSIGLKTFVLQSGEDNYYSIDKLCRLLEDTNNVTEGNAAITLSCGIFTKTQYKKLKQSGADRYLLRFETSSPKLHSYLRNGISLKRRLKALEDLKECDYEVGSGYMVGLPDETEDIRIENAKLCHKMKLDMIGIGPFIPHKDTPLKNSSQCNIDMTIRAVALVRMLLPKANIPATTASGTLDSAGREKVLRSGANVLMPNITPKEYKKYYLLYPNKICLDEDGIDCIGCLKERLSKINKNMVFDRGDSKNRELSN